MGDSNVLISPETRLTECPASAVSVAFVGPINERLDRLVELADAEGARTSRRELLAALILGAPDSAPDLASAVVRYRKARAKDAGVAGDPSEVLRFRRHPPGPRRRQADGSGS